MRGLFMIKLSQVRFTSLAETTYIPPNSALGISQPRAKEQSVRARSGQGQTWWMWCIKWTPSQPLLTDCHNDKFPDSSYALVRNTSTTSTCWSETIGQRAAFASYSRSVAGRFRNRHGVQ